MLQPLDRLVGVGRQDDPEPSVRLDDRLEPLPDHGAVVDDQHLDRLRLDRGRSAAGRPRGVMAGQPSFWYRDGECLRIDGGDAREDLAVAHRQPAARAQVLGQALDQREPLLLGEVDRHIAAEDHRQIGRHRPARVPQVDVPELHHVADLGDDPEGALARAAAQQEEPPQPLGRDALDVARGIDRAGGDLEHLQREVAGPDLHPLQQLRCSDSASTIAMLYGSWPEEQPADQIRTIVAGASFSQPATFSAMNVKCAGSRKNAV